MLGPPSPPGDKIMRIWKKLIAAYISAAGSTGPFVIGSFY